MEQEYLKRRTKLDKDKRSKETIKDNDEYDSDKRISNLSSIIPVYTFYINYFT